MALPSFLPRGGPAYAMAAAVSIAAGSVYYSVYAQKRDRAVMRAGVQRDKERLRQKKMERQQQQHEEHDKTNNQQ
jgi:hypothetical protein